MRPRDVVLSFDCAPLHANLDGWLHGGLVELVADTAMGLAARLEADAAATNRTLHLTLDFQEGARLDDRVECAATVMHRTRRFVWTRCELQRADSRVPVAAGSALQLLQQAKETNADS